MPRAKRIIKAGLVYHLLNRANGRLRIFKKDKDFEAFERIIAQAIEQFSVRIISYCIMSNHWHLMAWPSVDSRLSDFMKWLTVTHTQRWHSAHGTTGTGHVYQGRFKSFPIEDDGHYLTVLRYVESNPLRAGLVSKSQDWPWGSLSLRNGKKSDITLSEGPIALPHRWNYLVNIGVNDVQRQTIEKCIKRGCPFGSEQWMSKTADILKLASTLRPRGRPKNTY
jgi:putative transposase